MKTKSIYQSLYINVIIHFLFVVCAIACIYPILLTIGISFSDEKSLVIYGYSAVPKIWSIKAYQFILNSNSGIIRTYINTVFVTVIGTGFSVLVIALYAYPISRKDFTGKKFFTFFAFFTMLFNGGLVPWYIVCTQFLHIQNSFIALTAPYFFSTWYMLILRTFFISSIPHEIIESAKIDGAGEYRIFFQIVLALSKPGIATVALFSTLGYWNDWYLSMMLITNEKLYTLQYFLQRIFLNMQALQSNLLGANTSSIEVPSESARMAMCVLAMGPIIMVYPFFQKYFVKGLTVGAVKG